MMKILIVDDSNEKAEMLKQCVLATYADADVRIMDSARGGFLLVEAEVVDLVFLDVVVPMISGDTPSEAGSLWFVKEVFRKIAGPNYPLIVGTTQYADSISRVSDVFGLYLWSIVFVGLTEVKWQSQVIGALRLAKSNAERVDFCKASSSSPYDFAVITALRYPEFSEVLSRFGDGEKLDVSETAERWVRYGVEAKDGSIRTVVAACAGDMGMAPMASLVTKLAIAARPKILFLVGIMAGNKERVGLSDLVLAESSWDVRAGKLTDKGFAPDVQSRESDLRTANRVGEVLDEDFFVEFWRGYQNGERPQQVAQFHRGPVGCSPAVVATDGIFAELEEQRRKVLGLEMEGFGCYDAARRLGDLSPAVVCMKSVCDFGDGEKNDKYHRYCAALSATACFEVIRSF